MAATWAGFNSMPEKMNRLPTSTAVMLPSGLNACAKFSRRAALRGSPICNVNGLAAVSRNASPLAMTNSAMRKNQYCPTIAAGQNRMHPAP